MLALLQEAALADRLLDYLRMRQRTIRRQWTQQVEETVSYLQLEGFVNVQNNHAFMFTAVDLLRHPMSYGGVLQTRREDFPEWQSKWDRLSKPHQKLLK